MRCAACSTDNPASARFCHQCGAALQSLCSTCGTELIPNARFCSHCGAALQADATPSAAPTNSEPVSFQAEGERRHLTVLFCDLVGSTMLAARLDPEDWRAAVAAYHKAAAEAVTRYGGHVAKYLGDGVMAFFGWPEAHDNDAERAVRSGLALLEALVRLNENASHPQLAARIGIDSGAVVVGAGANAEVDVFGETPNIAARIQSVAEPGTIVVSADTHRLITGLFIIDDQGPLPLRGIAEPLRLYRIIQPSGVRGRFEAMANLRGLTPFVGRDDELRTLTELWESARNGQGQTALIIGEAGIGKSRLLHRFRQILGEMPHVWIESGTGVFFQNTPFHAVAEMLRKTLVSNDDLQDGIAKKLSRAGFDPKAAIPLLAPLLDLPLTGKYTASALPPDEQRRRLITILIEWILRRARAGSPHIIAIEDLHWADPSTLEFLRLLRERASEASLLQIYTARPEFYSSWLMQAALTQVKLRGLSNNDVRSMVVGVAAQNKLADETVNAVIKRTGGVPLFVEELTRAIVESGGSKRAGRTIPATLRDSLMARLNRLGPARETLQVGAVLGNEFSYELLKEIHPVGHNELERRLRSLTDAELLYVGDKLPERKFHFRHALIRDAAYDSLLKSRRKELHQNVAAVLTSESYPRIEAPPELIAHHCTEAGLAEQAVRYWRWAGRAASERSADNEAREHFLKGLALLNNLPSTSERMLEEVKLLIGLTTPLIASKGYTSPEVENASQRALELCQQLGEVPQLFSVLGRLNSIYYNRGDSEIAVELAKRMLRFAQGTCDPTSLLWAHYAMGLSLASQNLLRQARLHLEKSVALYDKRRAGHYGYVQDPYSTALCFLSHVIFTLGFPDRAAKISGDALETAKALAHPFTLAWVLGSAGNLHWRYGKGVLAQRLWQERADICSQFGLKSLLGPTSVHLGLALIDRGEHMEGLTRMRKALDDSREAFAPLERLWAQGLYAMALGKIGRTEKALEEIDKALVIAQTRRANTLGDFYLIKGQLLLMKEPKAARKAQQFFSSAIEIARKSGAKSDELSATIKLARLLAQQNHHARARSKLAEIYNWFTEGFDTPALIEAKALLDELGN
jgi:class 3 adenylate cyclase/tetratricopeptide (TPR) repeat protein